LSRSAAYVLLAVLLAGCTWNEAETPSQTDTNQAAMEALIAFARAPSNSTWTAVPLADSVGLGLGGTLRARRSARDLREPETWLLSLDLFRARAGTSSALQLIASEEGQVRVTHGPHRHCAAPPIPPPPQVADLERVVVQPREPDGCLDWWTVDAFVDDDGKIRAVTLDLWEP
jgi:hypothetical protein